MKRDLAQKMGEFIEKHNIKGTSEFEEGEDNVIICSRVEDFDPKSNDEWLFKANKSEPKGLNCEGCKKALVTSNGMFEMYQKAKTKPKAYCIHCVTNL